VARLAAGPRSALGMCDRATAGVHAVAIVGVQDIACDGSSAPPKW
jgi:hypothetical protein